MLVAVGVGSGVAVGVAVAVGVGVGLGVGAATMRGETAAGELATSGLATALAAELPGVEVARALSGSELAALAVVGAGEATVDVDPADDG